MPRAARTVPNARKNDGRPPTLGPHPWTRWPALLERSRRGRQRRPLPPVLHRRSKRASFRSRSVRCRPTDAVLQRPRPCRSGLRYDPRDETARHDPHHRLRRPSGPHGVAVACAAAFLAALRASGTDRGLVAAAPTAQFRFLTNVRWARGDRARPTSRSICLSCSSYSSMRSCICRTALPRTCSDSASRRSIDATSSAEACEVRDAWVSTHRASPPRARGTHRRALERWERHLSAQKGRAGLPSCFRRDQPPGDGAQCHDEHGHERASGGADLNGRGPIAACGQGSSVIPANPGSPGWLGAI